MVRAGDLGELITIQKRTVVNSTAGTGAPVETWAKYHRTRAEVLTRVGGSGSEQFQEAREIATARRGFRIRYNPTTAVLEGRGPGEYRILYPSTSSPPWDLEDAMNVGGARRELELICRRSL